MFGSLTSAIDAAKSQDAEEAMIIGGAALYEDGLGLADRIYLTEVHAEIDGDVSFPDLSTADWAEISRQRHAAGERDDYDHSFVVLDRVTYV